MCRRVETVLILTLAVGDLFRSFENYLLRSSAFKGMGCYAATSCPDAWMAFQGSCYVSYHTLYNYHDAEDKCKELGGYLVHIETATENTFIKSFLEELKADKHWIGLEDGLIEGVWKWHGTDTVASFTNWGYRQPDGATGSNCGAIWASFNYDWVDEPCTNRLFRPLCERRAVESEIVG